MGLSFTIIYTLSQKYIRVYSKAQKYYNFNMIGAWVGEGTPAFICLEPHDLYIEWKKGGKVDDQENIRRIMENSCV